MASLSNPRSMFIDDNFDDVQYSGTWFLDTYDRPGPFQFVGMTAKRTAHGTNATGGFSFSFEGTSVAIESQSNVIPATTNSNLRCTVDGVDVGSDIVSARNLMSWHLCHAPSLQPGRHDVVVNITAGENTVIWVDEIYYFSLPKPNLRRKYSMFLASTQEFQYTGVNWVSPFDDQGILGRETYVHGAKVTIPFYGVSLELTAYLTSRMPRAGGPGTYSVDGGPAVKFDIPQWTPGFRGMPSNETIYRVGLFTTPAVSPGHHTVEVINMGNAETVPLSIDYVYVQHGDVNASTSTAVFSPRPVVGSGTPSTKNSLTYTSSTTIGTGTSINDASAQKIQLGPVIGGIVGVLVVLTIAGFLVYRCLKRRKESGYRRTETRLTFQQAQTLNIQSRGLAAATGLYSTSPTPTTPTPYRMIPRDENLITPLLLPMDSSSRPPTRPIPPEKRRLLPESRNSPPEPRTAPRNRGMLSTPAIPVQTPAGRLSSLPPYKTDPDLGPGPPPVPRRLPPKLPPLKVSDLRRPPGN